jgi:hypothetical protein
VVAQDAWWGRITVLNAEGVVQGVYLLQGSGHPDMSTVEVVARLKLFAARTGGEIILDSPTPALRQLLDLVGLTMDTLGPTEHRKER